MTNDEKILKALEDLQAGQKVLQADVKYIKTEHGKDIKALKEDVNALKEDVNALKEDVKILKEDVRGLKEDVKILKEDVRGLKEDVKTLDLKLELIRDQNKKDHSEIMDTLLDVSESNHQYLRGELKKLEVRVANLEKQQHTVKN